MSVCKPMDPFVLLFRSESPSQVFMILLKWLLTLIQQVEVPPKVVVAYDNVCNLAKLKVARNPLPFPPPLDSVWHNVDFASLGHHLCHYGPERFTKASTHVQGGT